MTESCKNCFFGKRAFGDSVILCRKNSPVVYHDNQQGRREYSQQIWQQVLKGRVISVFPEMRYEDWCGEWKPQIKQEEGK